MTTDLSLTLGSAVEQLTCAIELVGPDGITVATNRAMTELTGYVTAQLVGIDTTELLRFDKTTFAELHRGTEVHAPVTRTEECVRPNGTEWLCETCVHPMAVSPHSNLVAVYFVERSLLLPDAPAPTPRGANPAIPMEDKELGELAHGMRGPLNAIVGYAEMLIEDAETAGRKQDVEDLRVIRSSGKELQSRIREVFAELDRRLSKLK